tara:strand:+ start:145 stop:1170 length:1026 start_codon:yes stop_codon:yes gene_type:complete
VFSLEKQFLSAWQRSSGWLYLFFPFTVIFYVLTVIRKTFLQKLYQGRSYKFPVVVVGNLNVGGAGKTPTVVSLANALTTRGLRPGIVSRGYGSSPHKYPVIVNKHTKYKECGDEPLLIQRLCACPVVVDLDRPSAINTLINNFNCNVIISDDGMQHYKMHRDVEIAVFNEHINLGSFLMLPSGPLREPITRVREVDYIISYGKLREEIRSILNPEKDNSIFNVEHRLLRLRNIDSGETIHPKDWKISKKVHLLAGIAYPEKICATIEEFGFVVTVKSIGDHKQITHSDIMFNDDLPIFITEKDAIKLDRLDTNKVWILETHVDLNSEFINSLLGKLKISLN